MEKMTYPFAHAQIDRKDLDTCRVGDELLSLESQAGRTTHAAEDSGGEEGDEEGIGEETECHGEGGFGVDLGELSVSLETG